LLGLSAAVRVNAARCCDLRSAFILGYCAAVFHPRFGVSGVAG
jgi:hypothetical protein